LTADVLGNLKHSSVYDNNLPATHGKFYRYRVIAKKAEETQEKEFGFVNVNLRRYSGLSVNVGTPTPEGSSPNFTQKYSVTPSVSVKNALQTGDKLVFYYVKGDYNAYQTGPYTRSIEFSKAELEAATPAAKILAIPKVVGTDNDAYVVVRIEADGDWSPFTNLTGSVNGPTNINSGDYAYALSSY
jgi:hypothetical protein